MADDNVIPFDPSRGKPETKRKGASAERMRELVRIREQKRAERQQELDEARARGEDVDTPAARGIRPPSDKEVRDRAIQTAADLLNSARAEAVTVLKSQLKHKDPAIRQRAAVKVLEYTDGKPTQTIVATNDNITKVIYETAALMDFAVPVPGVFVPGA